MPGLRFGQKDLVYPTAAEWRSQVLEQFIPTTDPVLIYPTGQGRQRAQGNIRPAKMFDLFAEIFRLELPYIAARSLQDTNNTLIGSTLFAYAYPDALMENINPVPNITPRRLVDNYITYRLREPHTALQGMSGPLYQGTHEQGPRLRETVIGTDGNTYEIHGQQHLYEVHFEIWAPGNKKADYLCDWVEDVLTLYCGWIISKGVKDMAYGWREMSGLETITKTPPGRIVQRELVYWIVLDRQFIIKKPLITTIEIGRQVENATQ